MKLCDYCGFVVKDQDAKCSNCRMIVPGRESMLVPPKVVSSQETVKSSVPTRSISSYIPKKLIAILLVIGLFASPQTQILLSDGMDYWDEMNTPYYTIPETCLCGKRYNDPINMYTEEKDPLFICMDKCMKDKANRPSYKEVMAHNSNYQYTVGGMVWGK